MNSSRLTDSEVADRCAFAIDLARSAGKMALDFQRAAGSGRMHATQKGRQDFVTEADTEVEAFIRAQLRHNYPEDGFLGEESGGAIAETPVWVVDPIDGTSNYMRGLSNWGVSIALVHADDVLAGIIYDANFNRVFHAQNGHGAFAEDQRLTASPTCDPDQALAFLGYSRRTGFEAYLALLSRLQDAGLDYRRPGAAAPGLLRVADGKADLYFEAHLNSWDAMAGVLIAREAGAVVDMPSVSSMLREGGRILAIAPGLAKTLRPIFSA